MPSLSSKIFLDGGDPQETKKASEMMMAHFGKPLDGQTTNPSLIAKNLINNQQITQEHALAEYKSIVRKMSRIIPDGSISIQVFANEQTTVQEMLDQARDRATWIPNGSIKVPCTQVGLETAETICQEMPINITLAFSQAQAAAVYEATRKTKFPVFISPFVGRLDDRGENGMQTVENMLKMYEDSAAGKDSHVQVLTASVRSLNHHLYALQLRSPIITTPLKVFEQWAKEGYPIPTKDYKYPTGTFSPIPYQNDIVLGKPWQEYNLSHDLTRDGLAKFYADWMGLFV